MSRPVDGGWHVGRSFHDRRCLFCTALGSDAVVRYGNGCVYSVCSDHLARLMDGTFLKDTTVEKPVVLPREEVEDIIACKEVLES